MGADRAAQLGRVTVPARRPIRDDMQCTSCGEHQHHNGKSLERCGEGCSCDVQTGDTYCAPCHADKQSMPFATWLDVTWERKHPLGIDPADATWN
jgi:hypothetical protein